MKRKALLAEACDGLAQDHHRGVLSRHGAVPRLAFGGGAHPAHALLGDLNREEGLAGDLQVESTAFPDRELAAYELRMALAQPKRALTASGFLVGHAGEDQITSGLHSFARQAGDDGYGHGSHVLHVYRAPSPQTPIVNLSAERRVAPL
jgi:hypothetical protein